MSTIHIIVGYKRPQYKDKMIEHFRRHFNVVLHPVSYFKEEFNEEVNTWIQPLVVNETPNWTQCYDKFNQWLDVTQIVDDDYYVFISDDDAFEIGTFDNLPNEDVIIISTHRGQHTPNTGKPYPPTDLIAHPDNMFIGSVDLMQMIFKGKIIKNLRWDNGEYGDGLMAIRLKHLYNPIYLPDRFGLFNYFQEGRYD